MSVFTADGKVLGAGGGFEPGPICQLLKSSLAKFQPDESTAVKPLDDKGRAIPKPPEGGLVLYVTWKVLGGDDKRSSPATSGNGKPANTYQDALGVDRLWVRKDEAESLAQGTISESLKKRMLPHLKYTMSGKVKELEITFKEGRLTGTSRSENGDQGQLLGFVEARDGKVARFDLVIKGWGERVEDFGFAAGLAVLAKGTKAPVAVLFSLADPKDDLARVLPHRSRDERYLK